MVNHPIVWIMAIAINLVVSINFSNPANQSFVNPSALTPFFTFQSHSTFVNPPPLSSQNSAIAAQLVSSTNVLQEQQSVQFQPISHPLYFKVLITIGGLGLIVLELWWFLGH